MYLSLYYTLIVFEVCKAWWYFMLYITI